MVLTRKCWAAKRTAKVVLYHSESADDERLLGAMKPHLWPGGVVSQAHDLEPVQVEIPVRPVRFVSHMPMVRRGL